MRNFILGFIVCFILMMTSYVFANESVFLGKKVAGEYPITIDGEKFDINALVIEGTGTSFVPVREFSERIGYEVNFDSEKGIILESQVMTEMPEVKPEPSTMNKDELIEEINFINSQIDLLEKLAAFQHNESHEESNSEIVRNNAQKEYEKLQEDIMKLQNKKEQLEQKLEEID